MFYTFSLLSWLFHHTTSYLSWSQFVCHIFRLSCWDICRLSVYKAEEISDALLPLATLAGSNEWKAELFIQLSLLSALLNWNHSVLAGPMFSSSPNSVLETLWAPREREKWLAPLRFIFLLSTKSLLCRVRMLYLFSRGSQITQKCFVSLKSSIMFATGFGKRQSASINFLW